MPKEILKIGKGGLRNVYTLEDMVEYDRFVSVRLSKWEVRFQLW